MPTAIKIGGNRSIRIAASTSAKALASKPMKVRSAIRKRINAMGLSPGVEAIFVHVRDKERLQMSPFSLRYVAFITHDDMIQYLGANHV